jgi:succinoglycan biosynthesis protein ExoO
MAHPDCAVSVIIPVFNSASTLERAVTSVLRQTLSDLEVIMVDDASRDTSLAEARALAASDPRVRVIALTENRGKPHAMNCATAQARGRWIAVLDADDWYEPERLAQLVAAGETHGVSLVADNQRFWDAGAGMMVRTAFPIEAGDVPMTRDSFVTGSDPYATFDFGMLKPLVRRDCIERIGLRYREAARLSEDFLYLLDFFAAGESGFLLAEPLYNWTQSFGTISRQWTQTGAGDWRYDYRSALAAYADVLHELRARQDDALARLLVGRMQAFDRLHKLASFNRMRKSGAALPRVLVHAARHPSIWPLLISRLIRA